MAKAPTPGVGKQKETEAHAKRVLSLTVGDETLEFCPDNLPFGERMAVRKVTTLNYDQFWGIPDESIIDLDAFRVLWWGAPPPPPTATRPTRSGRPSRRSRKRSIPARSMWT